MSSFPIEEIEEISIVYILAHNFIGDTLGIGEQWDWKGFWVNSETSFPRRLATNLKPLTS